MVKFVAVGLAAGLTVGGLAFGLMHEPTELVHAKTPAPPSIAATVPHPFEATKWVTISGRVVFPPGRAIPQPERVPADHLTKDRKMWEAIGLPVIERVRVNPTNRGLQDAVVFLRPDSETVRYTFPPEQIHPASVRPDPTEHVVRVVNGQFAPRVVAAHTGDRITFDNTLSVPINVYNAADKADHRFNALVAAASTYTTPPLGATRTPEGFGCALYPWMKGTVCTFDHPYFAVTDENGNFTIPNAPAGNWRLVVWHYTGDCLGVAGWRGENLTIQSSPTGKLELAPLTFASEFWP